ncbi:hypothetical protein CAEBREN_31337 [Caenorhabditis brenneri]|uniref:Serpentine Receptor, class H n=1 Tax=Caenorhabditis brenneri TaxID=135651 RepID=G0NTK4_CAEBE|nr:hypothetical protein CAEBREN_31337 [Caenorhabditis brenneri]
MCMSTISIFENRFYVVSSFDKNHFWTFWRRPWLAAHYIAFGLMLYHDAQLVPEQTKELFNEIFRELPCLPEFIYHSPRFVAIHKDYMFARVTIFIFMFTFTSEVSFFAVSMARNLMKQLESKKMAPKTYRMQRSFFNALVIQISLPMVFVVIPLTGVLFLRYTNIYNQAMTNCCLIAIGAHGLSSTTIMLIAHRPYRQTVLSWMKWRDGVSGSRVKVSVTPMPI